jgi:hypothetical protein
MPTSTDAMPTEVSPPPVDFLILGTGWTSLFLIPELERLKVTWAGTRRSQVDKRIYFNFDPLEVSNVNNFKALPSAKTVLITFGINYDDAVTHLVEQYNETHPSEGPRLFIQLGSFWSWEVSNV